MSGSIISEIVGLTRQAASVVGMPTSEFRGRCANAAKSVSIARTSHVDRGQTGSLGVTDVVSIDDRESADANGAGGVVSNFWPLQGTGAGNTTQETIELEFSGRLDFSAAKKIMMPGASL